MFAKQFTSHAGVNEKESDIGEEVFVLYQPDDLSNTEIREAQTKSYFAELFLVFGGLLLIVFGTKEVRR